jgi:hypothetical protein
MALNFDPELGTKHLARNQRAVERHLDDDHYVRGFTPGQFVTDGANAVLVPFPAAAPQWPAIKFPEGVISYAVVSWRKPSEWRLGRLRLRLWYTSDVASTANFAMFVRIKAVRDTEVLPGTALYDTGVADTFAGPSVINKVVKSAYIYTTTSLGSDDELFTLQLVRTNANPPDANANDMYLIYAVVEHIPAVRESQ